MSTAVRPAIGALAPWFGSNRMLAEQVGVAVGPCQWAGVPFLGGAAELAHLKARTIVANDLHWGVINLAIVVAHPELGSKLRRRLKALPFHAEVLRRAQAYCCDLAAVEMPDLEFAVAYFVACWMGRSAKAGTDAEFSGSLPMRWDGAGGDSAVRYRSAAESLRAWARILARVNFTCMDAFDFLAKCKDAEGHAIYCDPPFPGPGDAYRFKFTFDDHRRLAATLAGFRDARVVCRFYDHPLVRELYPESRWRWTTPLGGRKQSNAEAPEVLLVNRPGPAGPAALFAI